jgi:formate C-acetyltransferase
MNQRITSILNYVSQKKHHQFRQSINNIALIDFSASMKNQKLTDILREQERLTWVLENEIPVILPEERIVLTKTIKKIPELYTAEEWSEIKKTHYIHEDGRVCNINSNYSYTIEVGLEQRRKEVLNAIDIQEAKGNNKGIEFLEAVIRSIDDVEKLTDRYAEEAFKTGREDICNILKKVPRNGAQSFHEALQFFRILHFALWAAGNYQNTIGRFDQYMYKYLKKDLDSHVLDYDSAFDLLEEFFISFNKDSDLYPGEQQGDNGQSLVLGGVDSDGKDSFNILSEMCLKASLELNLIDPKINLRVNKDTNIEKYDLGTELTKKGLGFPQYSNDEIVIPGLVSKGYDLKDARNYVVAACWEFIIPECAMDIPNIGALSFAKVIDISVKKHLESSKSFELFMKHVKHEIQNELDSITESIKNIYIEPSPFQSLLMNGCIENAKDISLGAKYNNYGIHGTGIATAVDSLAAIKKHVYDEHTISAREIIHAVKNNFEDNHDLWIKVRYNTPKMGNDDDYADNIAIQLLNDFSETIAKYRNERGGCFRPGSGTAMYYLWHVKDLKASPDGRLTGEPLSANFSPSLNVKLDGPVSVIRSFSKPDMRKIMNGGPLTLELHDTVFRNPESIRKVSALVKSYMDMGGHQLQLNAVNREQLLDAKKNPELYKNLIVRVWGWSGYFIELEEQYQDHIIQRAELIV